MNNSESSKDKGEVNTLEEVVVTRLLRLNAVLQGIVTGIVFGLGVFAVTNWLVIKGGHIGAEGEIVVGPHLALLGQFFIGYRVSFLGSLIGFAYASVCGFVLGYLTARMYNYFVNLREQRSRNHT